MTNFNSRRFLVLTAVLVMVFASIATVSAQKESVPVTTKAAAVSSAAVRAITGIVTARDAFYLTVSGVNFDIRALSSIRRSALAPASRRPACRARATTP